MGSFRKLVRSLHPSVLGLCAARVHDNVFGKHDVLLSIELGLDRNSRWGCVRTGHLHACAGALRTFGTDLCGDQFLAIFD